MDVSAKQAIYVHMKGIKTCRDTVPGCSLGRCDPASPQAQNDYRSRLALCSCWREENREGHVTAEHIAAMLVAPVPPPKDLQAVHGHSLYRNSSSDYEVDACKYPTRDTRLVGLLLLRHDKDSRGGVQLDALQ